MTNWMKIYVLLGLALANPLTASAATADYTNWRVRVDKDPFTGRVDAGANLLNATGDALSIACNGNDQSVLSVQYRPKRYLGSTSKLVLIKIGNATPIPGILWEYHSRGAYTTSEPFVEHFSISMSNDDQKILVRAFNYEDQPVDAAFSSTNGRLAIMQIREACGAPVY